MRTLRSPGWESDEYGPAVESALAQFLAEKQRAAVTPQVGMFVGWLREFLAGGKYLRPLVCCYGWLAADGGGRLSDQVVGVAASLELFHAFALIHDDVMDGSDLRRGRPAAHRRIAACHSGHRDAERLGVNTAILLGDLALGWSFELVHAAGLNTSQAAVVWPLLDAMRVATMSGQYLDLAAAGDADLDAALAIARYKTAAYTVDYPLRVGAALAGAGPQLLSACSTYGTALGEAFQLHDDLLGVFGDPEHTGKPAIDDLRTGKHTALLAVALHNADPDQRRVLDQLVGDPDLDEPGADRVRSILTATGARATVEDMIADRHHRALTALAPDLFAPAAADRLRQLAAAAVDKARAEDSRSKPAATQAVPEP
ncbi:polyprenyl synthetase family protein [Nocardia sp. CA-135398]|uniref:polyprenyl synthetase family protein n=1 Tax=Nocardia sp. CA-135398 TaxID=3239977 RepID=UPI003D99E000